MSCDIVQLLRHCATTVSYKETGSTQGKCLSSLFPMKLWVPSICQKVHAAVFFVMTEPLMVVSKDLDIIMNAQCCCGTVQDLCIASQKKYTGMRVSLASSVPLWPSLLYVCCNPCTGGWFTIPHPAYGLYLSVCEVCVFDLLKNIPRAMN